MIGLAKRLKLQLDDELRFSGVTRTLTSRWLQIQAMRIRGKDDLQRMLRIKKLCAAATLTRDLEQRNKLEHMIQATVGELGSQKIDWTPIYPRVADSRVNTAAILKPYVSRRERGVLLISFERQWIKLLHFDCAQAVQERYILVLGPSWTPPHSCGVTAFPKLYPDRMFSTISQDDDMNTLPRLSEKIIPVQLLASNWVVPDQFSPLPRQQRDVDIVMVATFGKYKRHHALLRAMSRMPKTVRVLLIGTNGDDLDAAGIRALARAWGVEDMLVDVRSEDYAGATRAFCQARISVIMSKREGSCQAVVESMYGNTPVGILSDAELGSRKYVNEHTGAFLREKHLAEDILALLDRSYSMSPRDWVMDNKLSCYDSTRILNDTIRDQAVSNGEEWTKDIVPHAWNPYPEIVLPQDTESLRQEYRAFHARYGLSIGFDPARW
jgi:glycosyltransferase involved in cell wall biosynthesis